MASFPFRGERFNVDIPSDDDEGSDSQAHTGIEHPPPSGAFIKDIAEREMQNAPVAPTVKSISSGFPAHKKRAGTSRFKQQRDQGVKPAKHDSPGTHSLNREEIDQENKKKLAKMSDEEIALERQELMQQLSPSLIQRLLRRANIDESDATGIPIKSPENSSVDDNQSQSAAQSKIATRETTDQLAKNASNESYETNSATNNAALDDITAPSIHFPRPPDPPPLDPSSPNFLTDLHEKYFPNLPHDPSKLEWMNPPSSDATANTANAYASSTSSLPISALRFSFTGALLPPAVSNAIPTSKGLHHHGDSPEAAGYTIAELAHLARSSFPTQRCFAFQTLGRILYRLGIGEFGILERGFQGGIPREPEDDDDDDSGAIPDEQSLQDLARGLWDCIREGRVLGTLEAETNREGGHVSAKAYATEALWLWRKGGGTEVRAT